MAVSLPTNGPYIIGGLVIRPRFHDYTMRVLVCKDYTKTRRFFLMSRSAGSIERQDIDGEHPITDLHWTE
jgi:hypothetical protein